MYFASCGFELCLNLELLVAPLLLVTLFTYYGLINRAVRQEL
jgi:hypothetical protein